MRTITLLTLGILSTALAMPADRTRAADSKLSLVVNPRTGTAGIHNDTGASVNIDGYLLTAGQTVFNPVGWSTLTGNSVPGWNQGPAQGNRLGEGNLFGSLAIGGGTTVNLGTLYIPVSPTAIGQIEKPLTFEYSVPGVGTTVGDVVFAPQNNVVLIVNPATGATSLQNQSTFGVQIDGLLITSSKHALNPVGWNGLAESGIAGWTKGAEAANRLGEGSLFGSMSFAAGGAPISIGTAINPLMVGDETDLAFEYHIAGGPTVQGGIVFTAAATAPTLAGDYNGNGTVDAADYVVWRNGLGTNFQPTDYGVWRGNFGRTSASASASAAGFSGSAVPEPGTPILAGIVAIIASCVRPNRRPK